LSRVILEEFPNSQFIVVSLKRDFYRNADVIHTVSGKIITGILFSSVRTDVIRENKLHIAHNRDRERDRDNEREINERTLENRAVRDRQNAHDDQEQDEEDE